MPRKRDTTIDESLEELQKLEKRYRGKPEAARIMILRQLKEEPKRAIEEVAMLAGVSTPTVKRWWRAYREGGLEGMLRPVGRVRSEARSEQLEIVKRKLAAGEFKTMDDLEIWIAANKTEHGGSRHNRVRELPAADGVAIQPQGLVSGVSSGPSAITADDLFRFLAALPITHNIQAWIESFRHALQSLLKDVDRVSISMNLQCELINTEGYRPTIFVSQGVASGRTLVNQVPEHSGQSGSEHLDRFLANLHRTDFPFDEYQSPHSFVYYFRQHAYLGVILIWRQQGRAPLSAATIRTMERMQSFLELLLSDFVARHQAAKPMEQAFVTAIGELVQITGLTMQERRILTLQLIGFSYEEVAETLNISLNTVRYHLRSIYSKTDTHSQAELFAKYFTPRIDL